MLLRHVFVVRVLAPAIVFMWRCLILLPFLSLSLLVRPWLSRPWFSRPWFSRSCLSRSCHALSWMSAGLRGITRRMRREIRAAAPRGGRAALLQQLMLASSFGLTTLVSPPARAEEPSPEARARAEEAFEAGLKSRQRGQHALACEQFEASVSEAGSPHGWLQVGSCREATSLTGALEAFEAALEAARAVPDATRRSAYEVAARERIDQIERRVPSVTFRPSPTPGTSVEVVAAGHEAGVSVDRFDVPVRLNPGRYQVRVSAPGTRSHQIDIELHEAERREIELPALEPLVVEEAVPPAPVPPEPVPTAVPQTVPMDPEPITRDDGGARFGVWPYVLFGGGVALVGAGVVMGQLAMNERDELRNNCGALDPSTGRRICPNDQAGTKGRMEDYALAADLLWVGGALLAGTGVTLFVLDRTSETPTEVAAGCFELGCGLRASGSF